MQKSSIVAFSAAALLISGCTTVRDSVSSIGDIVPRSLERSPLFYKVDVQQGNSVEQAMVNRLEPGMSKSQVRYVMGTPMLIDVFHQNRWDYYYSLHKGNGDKEQRQLALFFDDNRLVRIEGDMRPLAADEDTREPEAEVYDVPDYTETKGIFSRILETTGLEDE